MNALLPRDSARRYTSADIFDLVEVGVIDRAVRFELVDGKIVRMSPKGRHHEIAREALAEWIQSLWSAGYRSLQEHTLVLEDGLMLEPDFILYEAGRRIADAPLTGADLRLVVEVADSSLGYDREVKAPLYAAQGVAEYWVLDAVRGGVRVHRRPSPTGWTDVEDKAPGEPVTPLCAPDAVPFRLG